MSDPVEKMSDIKMDAANLFREETYTDLKTGSIRRLVPVKADGTEDPTRSAEYSGHTQIMSPHGPLPIQGLIEAATLAEAVERFPQAMEDAVQNMVEEAQRYQREQANRIVTPGELGKNSGLVL